MIKLTRLQGEEIYINEQNIQWIECSPDTTITFINGNRFIVKENIEEVLEVIRMNQVQLTSGMMPHQESMNGMDLDEVV